MLLTDYFNPTSNIGWDYAKSCGIKDAVFRLPETEGFDVADIQDWKQATKEINDFGMKIRVIEPLPNYLHDHIKKGDDKREWAIRQVIQMLKIMDAFDIRTLCFNFMAEVGWLRTSSKKPLRETAYATEFNEKEVDLSTEGISEEKLWENYKIFADEVVPYAEKYGIDLALHPDDPPISPINGNVDRIMISKANIEKAMNIHPSENLGITMCQANFYLMGGDIYQTVSSFKDKIKFIHFRNVSGDKHCFHETFHDEGDIQMGQLMSHYKNLGIDVPIRVDHVPTMMKESENFTPGYGNIGKLYAIGYLKGLIENS